jgi:hypothetical protein
MSAPIDPEKEPAVLIFLSQDTPEKGTSIRTEPSTMFAVKYLYLGTDTPPTCTIDIS